MTRPARVTADSALVAVCLAFVLGLVVGAKMAGHHRLSEHDCPCAVALAVR